MKKIAKQYRQGDVLVTPIATIPQSAKPAGASGRVVLAEGEATGHCHAIDYTSCKMQVLTDGAQMYLRVKSPVVLHHQEHAPATITPGDYVVIRQVETWLDEVRRVAD